MLCDVHTISQEILIPWFLTLTAVRFEESLAVGIARRSTVAIGCGSKMWEFAMHSLQEFTGTLSALIYKLTLQSLFTLHSKKDHSPQVYVLCRSFVVFREIFVCCFLFGNPGLYLEVLVSLREIGQKKLRSEPRLLGVGVDTASWPFGEWVNQRSSSTKTIGDMKNQDPRARWALLFWSNTSWADHRIQSVERYYLSNSFVESRSCYFPLYSWRDKTCEAGLRLV